jgi:heme exporter protein C
MVAFLLVFVNFGASIAVLAWRRTQPARAQSADALAVSTAAVAVVYCTIVLGTGMLWARPIWGIWWTWDERLTSFLMLWLIYVSYLLLRRFTAAGQVQTLSAVLAIFGALDVPIVYMSTRWWRTQHPQPVIGGGQGSGLDPSMWPAVWWNLAAWFAWGVLMVGLRYALERRRQANNERAAFEATAFVPTDTSIGA